MSEILVNTIKKADGTGSITVPAETGTVLTSASDYLSSTDNIGVQATKSTPAFYAYKDGSSQSVSSSTWTTVQMNQEQLDTDNFYNTSNYQFSPTIAGWYFLTGTITFEGSGGSEIYTAFYKNNSTHIKYTQIESSGSDRLQVSDLVYFNGTGDYVVLQGWTNASSSPTFAASTVNSTMLGYLVRAT
jgi:hypothetical protein